MRIEQLIDTREVSRRLGLKPRGVDHMVKNRVIPVVKLSRRCIRFHWPDVEAAIEKRTVKALV